MCFNGGYLKITAAVKLTGQSQISDTAIAKNIS